MTARFLFAVAVLFACVAAGWGYATGLPFQTLDEAIISELRRSASPQRIEDEVARALDRDDVDDAAAYAELGDYLGWSLSPALRGRLAAAIDAEGRIGTHLARCAAGAVTAEMKTATSIACMVAADLTTLGDLRDIAIQGGALASDREYDPIVLGLSVVGLAATGVTLLTAGGGGPAKAGLSVMKAAKRASVLSPGLVRSAGALADDAVAPVRRVLAGADYRRPAALARDLGNEVRNVTRSDGAVKLMRAAEEVDDVRRRSGVTEAARMLRHAGSVEEVGTISKMYARLGRMTRPVIAITGKTSLHAFKVGYKLTRDMIAPLGLLLLASAVMAGGLGVRGAILRRGFGGQAPRRRWRDRFWPVAARPPVQSEAR